MMHAQRLPDGSLLIPRRVDGPGGMLGDSYRKVSPESEEGKAWLRWYAQRGEEIPAAPQKQEE